MNNHIKRFLIVKSNYCRTNITREYLHFDLIIPKIYAMYLELLDDDSRKCTDIKESLKIFAHTKIHQYNLCKTNRKTPEEMKFKIARCF